MSDFLSEEEKRSGISNFLQTSKQKPIICPKCAKKIQLVGGVKIEKCPFCREPLTPES